MSPAMNRFLMEGAELLNQDNNSVDRLMQYLDDNLTTLNSQLNPDNFERTLSIIFSKLSNIMYDLVEASLEVSIFKALWPLCVFCGHLQSGFAENCINSIFLIFCLLCLLIVKTMIKDAM